MKSLPTWPARRWALRPRMRPDFDPLREYFAVRDVKLTDGVSIRAGMPFPKGSVTVIQLRNLYSARYLGMMLPTSETTEANVQQRHIPIAGATEEIKEETKQKVEKRRRSVSTHSEN